MHFYKQLNFSIVHFIQQHLFSIVHIIVASYKKYVDYRQPYQRQSFGLSTILQFCIVARHIVIGQQRGP